MVDRFGVAELSQFAFVGFHVCGEVLQDSGAVCGAAEWVAGWVEGGAEVVGGRR